MQKEAVGISRTHKRKQVVDNFDLTSHPEYKRNRGAMALINITGLSKWIPEQELRRITEWKRR